jgi:hypothetical protein
MSKLEILPTKCSKNAEYVAFTEHIKKCQVLGVDQELSLCDFCKIRGKKCGSWTYIRNHLETHGKAI